MATIKINFRDTDTFVTDGSGETYFIGGDTYPTTRGGFTFGHVSGSYSTSDRDNLVDARLAGIAQTTVTGPVVIRVDLLSTGSKNIRVACGDAGFDPSNLFVQIADTSTPLIEILDTDGLDQYQFYDATEVLRTSAADWVSNNAVANVTFSTTICNITLGNGTQGGRITHIEIDDAGGGGGGNVNLLGGKLTGKLGGKL